MALLFTHIFSHVLLITKIQTKTKIQFWKNSIAVLANISLLSEHKIQLKVKDIYIFFSFFPFWGNDLFKHMLHGRLLNPVEIISNYICFVNLFFCSRFLWISLKFKFWPLFSSPSHPLTAHFHCAYTKQGLNNYITFGVGYLHSDNILLHSSFLIS